MVSIITPTYNAEKFISQNIKSVQSQTFKDYEHIIIDDSSKDNTVSIVSSYAETDSRIKLIILQQNSGAGIARNRGIRVAQRRFIAFLDADDFWHAEKLKKQISFMLNNGHQLTYTAYYVIDEESNIKYIRNAPTTTSYSDILKNDYIGCLTVIYDTDKIGKFLMPEMRKRQDWVLWIRILKEIKYSYGIKEPLAYYRIGNESLSKNKLKLLKHNYSVYRKELKMSSFKSIFKMIRFLFYYFIFKIFSKKHI